MYVLVFSRNNWQNAVFLLVKRSQDEDCTMEWCVYIYMHEIYMG